jgi:MIP family channel proteins
MASRAGAGHGSRDRGLIGAAVAELVGTFTLVLLGTGAVVATGGEDLVAIALAFGFAVLVVIYALGHVSGAHINPAVTIALTVAGKFPLRAVPVYLGAQAIGGVLASIVVLVLFGDAGDALSLGATAPGEGFGGGDAFLAELVLTFILLVVIVGTATDERADAPAVGLGVGLVVAAGILALGAVSGASFNPVRTLAPMLVSGDFPAWFAYIAGPVLGGVLGALLYDRVLRRGEPPSVEGAVEEKPKG